MTDSEPEKEKPRRNWERVIAIVVGAVLLTVGIIRNDFAILVLGAGALGVPGVINFGRPQAKTT